MSRFAFAFILLFVCLEASAQTVLQTQVNTSKSRFSGFGGVSYTSNLQPRNTIDSEAYTSGSLMVNYRMTGANLLRTSISGYQEQNHGQESKLNDSQVSWVNNSFWKTGKIITVGQQVRAVLPTSKESQLRDEKRAGVTLVPSFIVNLTPIGLTGVSLILQPQLTKNFHKFEQNRAFQSNTEYSATQLAVLSWSINDKIYLQPSFAYSRGWSYSGHQKDDSYQFNIELGYSYTETFIVALGMTNAGPIRNLEQGNDQTIELFNNRTASVYTALTYAF